MSVAVARSLVEPTSTEVPLVVCNPFVEPVTVYKGMRVATLQNVEAPVVGEIGAGGGEAAVEVEQEKKEMIWELVENTAVDLSPGEKDIFYHADVMAFSTSELGRTDKLQHHIPTGEAAPIRQLSQILEEGVAEPSTSPWASPVVLVWKKDGTIRFCIDFRRLNSVTHKDAYPLPRIDDTLDTLHGSRWSSTLDLRSGYWQVEVAKSDRPKTAFCTPEGLFQFRVMPFGLCNAPATFQRLMDLVLAGLQ